MTALVLLKGSPIITPIHDDGMIFLQGPSEVLLEYAPREVESYRRDGLNLIVQFHSGKLIQIMDFYKIAADGMGSDLGLHPGNGVIVEVAYSRGLPTQPAPPPDTTPPGPLSVALGNDTGDNLDGVSSDGMIEIGGLEENARWEYSVDGGEVWQAGSETSFQLPAGKYQAGMVQVRQIDAAGNIGPDAVLGAVSVIDLYAADDSAIADMGNRQSSSHNLVTDEQLNVLTRADDDVDTAGVPVVLAGGSADELSIEINQAGLIAVADAINVEIHDSGGRILGALTLRGDPLRADVARLGELKLVSPTTLVARVKGLAPGDYKIVLRKGDLAQGGWTDADVNGVSLQQMSRGGLVLDMANRLHILDAVKTRLGPIVGELVWRIVDNALCTAPQLSADAVAEVLSTGLSALGLAQSVEQVFQAFSDAFLSCRLLLLRDVGITVTLTQQSFSEQIFTGNVIDPDREIGGEPGEDRVIPGAAVIPVVTGEGANITVSGASTSIPGEYGALTINADGSYRYTSDLDPSSIGQTDCFAYMISDGGNSNSTARLDITIRGERLGDDRGYAGIDYRYKKMEAETTFTAIDHKWEEGVVEGLGSSKAEYLTSDIFTVAKNTTQDLFLNIHAERALGFGVGVVIHLETFDGRDWVKRLSLNKDQLVRFLSAGTLGRVMVPDVPEGNYRIRAEIDCHHLPDAAEIRVDVTTTVTHLDTIEVSEVFSTEGRLFDNDLIDGPPISLAISSNGEMFVNVLPASPCGIRGSYGSLQVNFDGTYSYLPDERAPLGKSADTFTYRTVQNGIVEEATLTVTILGQLEHERTSMALVHPLKVVDDEGACILCREDQDGEPAIVATDGANVQFQSLLDDNGEDGKDTIFANGDGGEMVRYDVINDLALVPLDYSPLEIRDEEGAFGAYTVV